MQNTGMALEEEVYLMLRRMIAEDELPYRKDRCRLHRRKAYYSPDRKGKVHFENVVEVFRRPDFTEDTKPTHVLFFECKDHTRYVEVGKVDEVVGRLKVSFGFALKGYIATRKGFSKSALETARSNGIGLIKILPDHQTEFILELMTMEKMKRLQREANMSTEEALLDFNHLRPHDTFFFGVDGPHSFPSFDAMLRSYLKPMRDFLSSLPRAST